MPDGDDWNTRETKTAAIYKVLRYLAKNPDAAAACVGNDQEAARLFEEQGGITIPTENGARVIFFAHGEQALRYRNSVVLEVPPADLSDAPDGALKSYVIGNYPYWPI
jgi:hypothetical protein